MNPDSIPVPPDIRTLLERQVRFYSGPPEQLEQYQAGSTERA